MFLRPSRRRRLTRRGSGETPPRRPNQGDPNSPGSPAPWWVDLTMGDQPNLGPGAPPMRQRVGKGRPGILPLGNKAPAMLKAKNKAKPKAITQWGGSSGSGGGHPPPKPPPGEPRYQPRGGMGAAPGRANYQPVYPRGTRPNEHYGPVRNTGRPQQIGKGGRSQALVPVKKSTWQHIQEFGNQHGTEAAVAGFGVLALAAMGMPLFGAAGAAAGAAELGGIELPLMGLQQAARVGLRRGIENQGWNIMREGVEAVVPAIARRVGWGPIRRAVGWEAARRMGGPYV